MITCAEHFNVAQALEQIRAYRVEGMVEAGTAEYLVIGNRPVGGNPFRLTGSSETWNTIFNRGELAKATLSITLEEYA